MHDKAADTPHDRERLVGALSVETYAKIRNHNGESRNGNGHSGACSEYMYRNDKGKCVDARNKSGKPFVDDILSKSWKP
jgi:hypothetical protein